MKVGVVVSFLFTLIPILDVKKISLLVVDLFRIVTNGIRPATCRILVSGCFYREFKVQNNLRSVERSELERNSAFLTITVEIKYKNRPNLRKANVGRFLKGAR